MIDENDFANEGFVLMSRCLVQSVLNAALHMTLIKHGKEMWASGLTHVCLNKKSGLN